MWYECVSRWYENEWYKKTLVWKTRLPNTNLHQEGLKFWNQDRVVLTCLHKKDQSSLSWYLDFCLYHLLLVCFLFCLSSGKLMHYLSACGQKVTVTSYHNLPVTSFKNSFILTLEIVPCQILPYHKHLLPPSYLINWFSILGTFLLLCFYFGFSFLQFFLIYNLDLNWYNY